MRTNTEISAELHEISPYLTGLSLSNPYKAPDGYFDEFPVQLMQKLETEAVLPVMQSSGYEVPQGYFDTLSGDILSKIKVQAQGLNEVREELETVAPLLSTISKANVYTVPQRYFENISFVPKQQPAKIVKFRFAKRLTQYAAAAVLAGVLITGAFLYTGNKNTNPEGYNHSDVASELNKVSETDLASYIDNPENGVELMPDVKQHISSMTDEELNQYLSENQEMEIIPVSN